MNEKLRKAGEILVWAGALFTTLTLIVIIMLFRGLMFSAASSILIFFATIYAVVILTFTWLTPLQAINRNSFGWTIVGIIISFGSSLFSLIGYIFLLICNIQDEDKPKREKYQDIDSLDWDI